MDKSILEEKHFLLSADFNPFSNQLYLHPEDGQNCKINSTFEDIKTDLESLDKIVVNKSTDLNNLLTTTITRLEQVEYKILREKERLQDISMLCNKYTDFDKIININKENSTGNFNYSNETFSCYINSHKNNSITIDDVIGNGIEGNRYVYKDFKYVDEILNTSNRKALTDNKISTYWEYERITASSQEEYLIHDFNVDSEEAKCTISLFSSSKINELEILTDRDDIKVIGLKCSDNGVDYSDIVIPNISLNKKLDSYNNVGYVYGSNFVSIPNKYYIKITLQSDNYTDDKIAYERILFKSDSFDEKEVSEVFEETTIIESAKRHLIKISDIKGYQNQYSGTSYVKTKNLISDEKVYAVGLFANIYIPNNIGKDCIEFILTVNGIDYNVIPVNAEGEGIKIIRFSKGASKPHYTQLTDEIIKSVILTIKLKSHKNLTPYLNNIKILLGGEI